MGKERDKKDNPVEFSFKDRHKEGISYDAGFYPGDLGGEVNWLDLTQMPGSHPHFYREDAWELFRNNATFNDILNARRGYHILDVIHQRGSLPDFKDSYVWTDQKFLAELSEHPDWLATPETDALQRFISIVRTANGENNDESNKAIQNLGDYFIPKRPGGKKSLPVNFAAVLYLLTDLSNHLSKLCRDYLRDGIPGDRIAQVRQWAADNDEPRILDSLTNTPPKNLSTDEKLSLLIDSPKTFAKTILAGDLRMSPSTLRSALYK